MGVSYLLDFHGESLKLISSDKVLSTESDFINVLNKECTKSRTHLITIQLKLIFEKFDSICRASFDWRDNLKTILAHGFNVKRVDSKGNSMTLMKSFKPVQFKLLAIGCPEINLGYFHMGSDQVIHGQFMAFCKATEYPPDIHRHIVSGALITNGGALISIGLTNTELLVDVNPTTKIIKGNQAIIEFLSDPCSQ